jgi:hypothetical protein
MEKVLGRVPVALIGLVTAAYFFTAANLPKEIASFKSGFNRAVFVKKAQKTWHP